MSPESVPSARCIDVIQTDPKLIVARDFADPTQAMALELITQAADPLEALARINKSLEVAA